MKIPDVDIPVTAVRVPMEWLMRAERAVEKVRERLLKTCRAFENASVPYVVIGGNAVAVWVGSCDEGAVRNTKDVDVLLERSNLGRATIAMSQAGFDVAEVNGVTMFLDRTDPMPSRAVHVIFAGEKIRSDYEFPAPQPTTVLRDPDGVPAPSLVDLLVMKLQSFRLIDRVHVQDLVRVGAVSEDVAAQIPPALRPRLEEIRANPNA